MKREREEIKTKIKTKYWWKERNHLEVINNQLFIAGKNVALLAEDFGTPLFILNVDKAVRNYKLVKNTFSKYAKKDVEARVYYAMKANSSIELLEALKNEEAFIDTTSINEVKRAIEIGYSPQKIIFTGINFGLDNFEFLVKSGVLINIDSFSQMRRLADFAPLDISIRWNPGIGIGFHKGLILAGDSTGALKLGIYKDKIIKSFLEAKKLGLNPIGLHQHIGSNWFGNDMDKFLKSVQMTLEVIEELYKKHRIELRFADLGGGIGVRSIENYPTFPLEEYCKTIWTLMNNYDLPIQTVAIEPGRYIAGNAGILVTTVNMVENKGGVDFVGIDAGFNLFNHYFFFGIEPEFINCSSVDHRIKTRYSIGGYLCESSDIFASKKIISKFKEQDILAIYPAGAYGQTEASSYHLRNLPRELSLLPLQSENIYNFCKACPHNCCYIGPVSVFIDEYKTIVEHTSRSDVFRKIEDFYIIDKTLNQPCPFLNHKNNKCLIHNIKPIECKAWPLHFSDNLNHSVLTVDHKCPYRHFIKRDFINYARKELYKIPPNLRTKFYEITLMSGYELEIFQEK